MVSKEVYLHEVLGAEKALEPALVMAEGARGGLRKDGVTRQHDAFAFRYVFCTIRPGMRLP